MNLTDYLNKIKNIIKDDANYLSDDDISISLNNALSRMSKDHPLIIDKVYTGDGGYVYELPEEWVNGFSYIQAIEYPYGNQDPEYLEEDEFNIYQSSNSYNLRFLSCEINSDESFMVYFSVLYKITSDNNNFPDSLSNALINLSAYFAYLLLAGKYSQLQNIAINADQANYGLDPNRFRQIAKDYYSIYENLLFNKTIGSDGYSVKAALITQRGSLQSVNNVFH